MRVRVIRFCEWKDIRSNSLTKEHRQGNEAGDVSHGDGRHFHLLYSAETRFSYYGIIIGYEFLVHISLPQRLKPRADQAIPGFDLESALHCPSWDKIG